MLTRTKVSNRINLNVNSLKYILIQNKTFSLPAAFGGLFFIRILKKDLTPPPARPLLKEKALCKDNLLHNKLFESANN